MIRVKVQDNSTFNFINQLLASSNDWPFDIRTDANEQIFETNFSALASMIERARDEKVFVLPFRSGGLDAWVITGSSKRDLFETSRRIANFIVPSYAKFYPNEDFPTLSQFDPQQSNFGEVGSRLYPEGYFSLRSPQAIISKIFSGLENWSNLDEQRPTIISTVKPSYREMLEKFESHLAGNNWREAHSCLQEIRHNNLTTTENLSFLEIYLLSKQSRWDEIWGSENYENLAKMKVPRNVRAALLSSFYYCVLAQYEESSHLNKALEKFQDYKARLGLLLTGRFQINEPPVLKVFSYLAVHENDVEGLSELRRIKAHSSVEDLIQQLEEFIPIEHEGEVAGQDRLSQARIALAYSNFDKAYELSKSVPDALPQLMLKMEIAFMSGDPRQAEDALLTFWDLPRINQHEIVNDDQRVSLLVDYLTQLCDVQVLEDEKYKENGERIKSWVDWFGLALDKPEDPRLKSSIPNLEAISDDRGWDTLTISLLSDRILNIGLATSGKLDNTVIQAIRYITNQIILESEFPRDSNEFIEFYEVLLVVGSRIFEKTTSNSRQLLRLAEAFLTARPSSVLDVWKIFSEWYSVVIPSLDEELLNTYDALWDAGFDPNLLIYHFRSWLEKLLGHPGYTDEIKLRAWQQFCEWIEPGTDLLEEIIEKLSNIEVDPSENLFRSLNEGFRVGIFTLNEQSANRAKDQLLEINPGLDIRICTSKVLTDEAVSIATNSDIVVIVTSCLTHALSTGIKRFLKSVPIYPPSSGSIGIVRTIVQHFSEN